VPEYAMNIPAMKEISVNDKRFFITSERDKKCLTPKGLIHL